MTAPPPSVPESPTTDPTPPPRSHQTAPALMWLGVVVLVLIAAGSMALSRDPADAETLTTAPPLSEQMQLGRQVYAHCIQCHQAHGQGIPRQFPPLAQSEWVLGDPGRLVRIIHHGMMGPVRVRDQTYNGVMPGWPRMTDQELAAVLTYIRGSWGNDATAVSSAFVRSVRRDIGHRPRGWTAAELMQLPPSVDPQIEHDSPEKDL